MLELLQYEIYLFHNSYNKELTEQTSGVDSNPEVL